MSRLAFAAFAAFAASPLKRGKIFGTQSIELDSRDDYDIVLFVVLLYLSLI